jgi:diguanylate cyclase (GGDEF)-like protein
MAGLDYIDQAKISNIKMLTLYSPIKNAGGEVIGMLFAAHHLSDKTNAVLSFITSGIIITAMLLGISIVIILRVVHLVATPINEMLDKINYDGLTGIYNRRFLEENLKRIMKSLSRSGSKLSLLIMDVDYFKKYNDTYGHVMGDECLRIIAKTLKHSATRTEDFVARYGGEEFAVVLPNTREDGAVKVANRMLEAVRNCKIPHESSAIADHVTISIGVTTGIAGYMQSVEEYINRADEMLYKSKHEGRNRYNFSNL